MRALVTLLHAIGHPVTGSGPASDGPEAPVTLPDVPPDELASWLRAWPDEPLDVLEGVSPREALHQDGAAIEIDMLVRYLEHDADARGVRGLATEALRAQLGLGSGSG
jgi:hypothetical protein